MGWVWMVSPHEGMDDHRRAWQPWAGWVLQCLGLQGHMWCFIPASIMPYTLLPKELQSKLHFCFWWGSFLTDADAPPLVMLLCYALPAPGSGTMYESLH